ncbi:MAG: hypothetical protein AABY27_05305 [Pseudomonadota bacterium]
MPELTRKLEKLYSLQRVLPKILDTASITERDIDSCYVTPQLQVLAANSKVENIDLESIFHSDCSGDLTRILVEGEMGTGKTTIFSQKLPYDCFTINLIMSLK